MTPRPLALALATLLLPLCAQAEDLVQAYELARNSDPQLAAAESGRLATREGAVQARASLLPQLSGDGSYSRSNSESEGSQAFGGTLFTSDSENNTTSRQYGLNLSQMVYDHSNITRLRSQNALAKASDFRLESAGDSLITRSTSAVAVCCSSASESLFSNSALESRTGST